MGDLTQFTATMGSKRSVAIDFLRAVAVLLVLFRHAPPSGVIASPMTRALERVDHLGVIAEVFFIQNYFPGIWNHTWSLVVEEHFYSLLALLAWVLPLRDHWFPSKSSLKDSS